MCISKNLEVSVMRKSSLVAPFVSLLTSCAFYSPSGPRLIGEKYYMIGGEDCALYNQTEEQKHGEISCYAPDGRFTEVRHQMTLREIQAWALKQQVEIERQKLQQMHEIANKARQTSCVRVGHLHKSSSH